MSEPKKGQLTTDDRIAIGKAASFLRFQAAYSVDATEPARQEWRSTAEALTDIERRCNQPATSSSTEDILGDPVGGVTMQPAEDPDEWVIQNRVPRRVKVDQFVYLSPREMSLAIPEESWQFFRWSSGCPAGEMASDGRKHGFVTVNGNTLHVRCRRRDLPKVDQKTLAESGETFHPDGTSYRFDEWTDNLVQVKQITEAEAMALLKVADSERVVFSTEPQPQKTRVSDESLELIAHVRDQVDALSKRVAECERQLMMGRSIGGAL